MIKQVNWVDTYIHNFPPTLHIDIGICVKTRPEGGNKHMLAHAADTEVVTWGETTTYKVSSFSLLPQRGRKEKRIEQLCFKFNSAAHTVLHPPIAELRNHFTNAPPRLNTSRAPAASLARVCVEDFWFSLQVKGSISSHFYFTDFTIVVKDVTEWGTDIRRIIGHYRTLEYLSAPQTIYLDELILLRLRVLCVFEYIFLI